MVPTDHIGPRTVSVLLEDQIVARPDAPATVFEDPDGNVVELSYRQLGERVARVAGGFAAIGIGHGDRVLICLPNRPETVITFLALGWLGAVAVPANTANGELELAYMVERARPRTVVTSADFLGVVEPALARAGGPACVVLCGEQPDSPSRTSFAELEASAPAATVEIDSESPLEIIFTSGTTARPKGVVLTHANWLWSGERASHWLRVDDRDRLLTALPLFHVNAQSFTLLAALTVGATAIFLQEYSASRFIGQARAHQATHTSLVAMLLRTLLAQPASDLDCDHQLRRISYAINVSDTEKDEFERRFGVELLNGYGLSEAMTEVTVCPAFGERRWPSIGRPAFGRNVRVVGPDLADREVGEVGEILVEGVPGRTIMKEYLGDPEATAETIVDGWLRTGDNGYFDADGFLFFYDRAKDVIKRAGENVSASEVEVVIAELPEVSQAAVVGVPDPVRDEAVMAFVVPVPGAELSEETVASHCGERLARFKVPTAIEIRESLPTTSIGKVEKGVLRGQASGRLKR